MIKPELYIGIIGCGKMGRDLFDFLTGFRFNITLVCRSDNSVEQVKNAFSKKQKRALKYKLIDEDAFEFSLENTTITTEIKSLQKSDLIIEAIPEDIQQKRILFKQLKEIISSNCIVVTNSSSIPPVELFSGIINEEKCAGLHFFYPVVLKDLVEVNLGEKTSAETISKIKIFLQKINKFYITLSKYNHFIINRIFLKMQAGCCQLLEENKLAYKEIDEIVKANLFPVGVFEFFDHVGNDVMLQSVRNYVKYETEPEFYRPLLTALEQKVNQGKFGLKTNSGFYHYPLKDSVAEVKETPKMISAREKIINWYLEGVFDAMEKTGLTKVEMAHIIKEYMMVEKSPFALADEIGFSSK